MSKYIITFVLLITFGSKAASQSFNIYPIKSAEISKVKLTEGFWAQRYKTNRDVTIPHLFEQLKKTNRIDNLLFASKIKNGVYCTNYPFDESDIYKTIEAASYILMLNDIPGLEEKIDTLITIISKVQQEDGYLYSARNSPSEHIKKSIGPERWSNLQWSHELYNLGHLYEAASAHYTATGKVNLLNIAIKNAELILSTFGPSKLQLPPGHQEIELGLVKLYEVTGNEKYLDLAKYFLDIRGRGKELTGRESWGKYAQDHLPVIEQKEVVGHAVRAAYQYSSMTDMAALNNNDYESAVKILWENLIAKKLYITGGIGSTGSGEAFGEEYELPNLSGYNETCSSIANMTWNYKMFQLFREGKYLDLFERTLYNSFLSGIGMEGNLFFYPNPLASYGSHVRSKWFTCACCPPNISRFIASLPSKIYSVAENEIYVNIYAANTAEINLEKGSVNLAQETNYPWDGNVKLTISPEVSNMGFKIKLRIPGWLTGRPVESDLYSFMEKGDLPTVSVNGIRQSFEIEAGFITLSGNWNIDDIIELNLPMNIHRITTNEKVESNIGKTALQRGPIVYCLEWPENGPNIVDNLLLEDGSVLDASYEPDLLNGIETINGKVTNFVISDGIVTNNQQMFKAIPYYSWSHRGKGEMAVWINRDERFVNPVNSRSLIEKSIITASGGINIESLTKKYVPENEDFKFFYWESSDEKENWIKINFPDFEEVSTVEIYWVTDSELSNFALPISWKVQYNFDESWRDVYPTENYTILQDQHSSVNFETVKTSSLKILIEKPSNAKIGTYGIKIK